jgi:probable F420-dependent oxidoreductase
LGRVIGALGPVALGLAAERAAGAHPYNVPPAHTAQARQILGPGPVLVPEQKVLFETDAATARQVGREVMNLYLTRTNYINNLRSFGFADDDFADGGSDRVIDTMVAWGTPETIRARVREHLDAGADQVAVQVLGGSGKAGLPRDTWHQTAEVLLGL